MTKPIPGNANVRRLIKNPMDAAIVRTLFHYDPSTGVFTRLLSVNGARWNGLEAGSINAIGYRIIRVGRKDYLAHRLAWLYITGAWPLLIDHIDRCGANNKFANLREANKSTNGANRGKQANNSSGFKGVKKHRQKWTASITIKGINTYLGLFSSPEAASAAYHFAAKQEYGEFACI